MDQKVPRDSRDRIPVFECRGDIVWIPGYRIARGWEVKDPRGSSLHIYVRNSGTADPRCIVAWAMLI